MSDTSSYVSYFITPKYIDLNEENLSESALKVQQDSITELLANKDPNLTNIASFTEKVDSKKSSKWPELTNAIEFAKTNNATLVIAEIGTLTNNEHFAKLLLNSNLDFMCADQPYINLTVLEALSKHAKIQKKLHGKLIREGLEKTSAKSGNPNAAEVISKVNKPKIDTAIVFAFLLQPIVKDYKRSGYSQRQMVKLLNDEGFTAPEGGKWVLSQLQKVLDRVKLNEVATNLKPTLKELQDKNLTPQQLAEELSHRNIPPLKKPGWNEQQINKLLTRLEQIKEIELINNFVISMLPLLHEFQSRKLSVKEILKDFQSAGIPVRQPKPQAVVA